METENQAYDIIILAGQSNAEGCGIGGEDRAYKEDERVMQLVDKNRERETIDERALTIIEPFEFELQVAKENGSGNATSSNFALFFARDYVANGRLQEGRKVLIVKSAFGGTGFSKHHWGKDEVLSRRMFAMTDTVLSWNPKNRIVAFLWHQGEHDAFEDAEISPKVREEMYAEKFGYLMQTVAEKYGVLPLIAGGFSNEWKKDYEEECEAIYRATKRVLKVYDGKFVETEHLTSNNQDTGNGDPIHFCRKSLEKLGQAYYAAYAEITDSHKKI